MSFESQYQDFIYKRTYSRWIDKESRRESWEETIDRYEKCLSKKVPEQKLPEFNEVCAAIKDLKVMPSMRSLWTAGPALERENIAGYNCAYTIIDNVKSFAEILYILMCGTGVGFSVERQYVNKLPIVPKLEESDKVIVVADSKKGWADAFYSLLKYLYAGSIPSWDMSKVRPKGSRLKIFGGRASGPEPLADLFQFTVAVFKSAQERKLSSIECHDVATKIASVVVVGGVRRSACISLSNLSDDRMAHCKDGLFWEQNPQRSLANNSVAYTEKPDPERFLEEWLGLIRSKSGERGIFNRESAKFIASLNGRRDVDKEFGCNPCCFAGDMHLLTSDGYRKFSELNGKTCDIVNSNGDLTLGSVWEVGKKDVVEIVFESKIWKRRSIVCTDDHVFMLNNGTECMAKDLEGKRLMPYKRDKDKDDFVVKAVKNCGLETVYDFNEPVTSWGVVEGVVVHNSEIILQPKEFCNLTEIIVREKDTIDTLKEKARFAAILGCVQATLTDFNFISRDWKRNCEEERLLGVSMTGLRDHPVLGHTSREAELILVELKQIVIDTAKEWSNALGINMPAATSCVKPSGTVSQLTDCASGLHPRYSPFYIRRVRVSSSDPMSQFLIDRGIPYDPEVGEVMETASTYVFAFPVKAPESAVMRDEENAIKQLEYWKMLQVSWCEHKPSITIYVKDSEWIEVGSWVYNNWNYVSGISFLPYNGGIYPLAPYEEIDEDTYNEMVEKMPILNFDELSQYEKEDKTEGAREFACAGGSCELI